jgi:hypothetical protein
MTKLTDPAAAIALLRPGPLHQPAWDNTFMHKQISAEKAAEIAASIAAYKKRQTLTKAEQREKQERQREAKRQAKQVSAEIAILQKISGVEWRSLDPGCPHIRW